MLVYTGMIKITVFLGNKMIEACFQVLQRKEKMKTTCSSVVRSKNRFLVDLCVRTCDVTQEHRPEPLCYPVTLGAILASNNSTCGHLAPV